MKGFVPWITLLFLQSFPPLSLPRHLTNETPAAWQLLAAPCSAARRPSQQGPFLCEVLLDFSDQPPFQQEGSTDACALLPCVPGPALQMLGCPCCMDENRREEMPGLLSVEELRREGCSPSPAAATVHAMPLCELFPLRLGQDHTLSSLLPSFRLGKLVWH